MTSNGELSAVNWNENVANILERKVALEYPTLLASRCKNGHSVCAKCSVALTSCPLCHKEVTKEVAKEAATGRSRPVKKLANLCPHPCFSQSRQTLKGMVQHLAKCPYRMYECEIGGEECNWTGLRGQIRAHVQEEHDERYCEHEVTTEVITEFEYHSDYLDSKMMFVYGEIFIMYLKITERKLYGAVKYIGLIEKAKKFLYEFELCSKDGRRRICHRYNSHPDIVPTEVIFDSEDCFTLGKIAANKFVINDALRITVRVSKV